MSTYLGSHLYRASTTFHLPWSHIRVFLVDQKLGLYCMGLEAIFLCLLPLSTPQP